MVIQPTIAVLQEEDKNTSPWSDLSMHTAWFKWQSLMALVTEIWMSWRCDTILDNLICVIKIYDLKE